MTFNNFTDTKAALSPGMERLKLRHLQLLDQLKECGSLSAAAQSLRVSQPGATKMLKELETAFGLSLVARTPRGGRLTPAGLLALERVRVALGSLATARRAMGQVQDRPLVRLGILPLVGIEAMAEVVAQLQTRQEMPRMVLRMGTVEGLLDLLSRGEVDAIIGGLDGDGMPDRVGQLQVRPLWKLSLVLVAAKRHPLVRRKAVSWSQTLEHEWVLMPHGSSNRRALERAFLSAGLSPPQACVECESFHIGMSLVEKTQMLTVVPLEAYWYNRDQVSRIPMESDFFSSSISWITLKDSPDLPSSQAIEQAFAHYAANRPSR